MKQKQVYVMGVALAAFIGTIGCTSVSIPATVEGGAVSYCANVLRSTEPASIDMALAAGELALEELGFSVTDVQINDATSIITARGAHDKKVKVLLREVSDQLTHVRISGSHYADVTTPLLIVEALRKNLSGDVK